MSVRIVMWNHRASFLFPPTRGEFIAHRRRPNSAGRYQCGGDRRGRGILALSDDKKSKRAGKDRAKRPSGEQSADRDVGHALRTVYSSTVNEEIPTELLDLLGKLS
ncbi:MAG TPA: NepR family anti-sigma factor [Sphingomonas sp.]